VLTKWFLLKSWIRFAIVAPAFVAAGFATDTLDHAEGWKDPTPSSFVTLPLGLILLTYLSSDRPNRLKKKDRSF
jgi:hypothetical protein